MVHLSGFADEISPDLKQQLDTLCENEIKFLELRGVWGKNVLNLTDEELQRIKDALEERGIGVSAIGSPLGKVRLDEDWEKHLADTRRILEIACFLDCRYIRVFSFYPPEGQSIVDHRDEVLSRLKEQIALAKEAGVKLLHENEKHIYGETGERCLDLMQNLAGEAFGAIFDPANYVQAKEHPYSDCWLKLRDYVEYFHIKDALLEGGKVVLPGKGDGDLVQILQDAQKMGFSGFLSLEPHLQVAGERAGFSGPELFTQAANALKSILDQVGLDYS